MGFARGRFLGQRVPLFASLEVTRACDRRCTYCGSRPFRGKELTGAEWLGIIDDLARSGTLRASFTGGEPLLRPDLPELVNRCVSRGIEAEINTNGRLLAGMIGALSGVSCVTISLDGVEEVNDTIRGRGAFASAIEGYRAARSAGVRAGFLAVLSRETIPRLPEFIGLISNERLPVLFQPVFEWYLRSRKPIRRQPVPGELRRAIDLLKAARGRGVRVTNSDACLEYLRRWPGPASIACGGGRYFVRISNDGMLGICGLKCDTTPDGIDARLGVLEGMRRMPHVSGTACWCAGRTEVNLALELRPAAVAHVFRRL